MELVEALAKAIHQEGTQLVVNLPDEVTVFLSQALSDLGVRIIRPRHEQNGVLIADGYSRTSGRLGVVAVGHGPALAQTGTALTTAKKRRSRMLVLVGRESTLARGSAKRFDERRFVESTGCLYMEVRDDKTLYEDVHEAFRVAGLGRGPVVLSMPSKDLLLGRFDAANDYVPTRTPLTSRFKRRSTSREVEEAAAMLINARLPIIFAGRGAVESNAEEALMRLAERSGALLATSLQARGLFDGHPNNIGLVGTYATESTVTLVAAADCVLAMGVSLNPYQTGGGTLAPSARTVHVDIDPASLGAWFPVELAVVGDARAVAQSIDSALRRADVDNNKRWQSDTYAGLVEDASRPPDPFPPSSRSALPTSYLLSTIDKALPADRLAIIDGGFFTNFVVDQIRVSDPAFWIWTQDFASIGLGLGMAIGASLGRPDQQGVLLVGDGGFAMSLQELDTLARESIPLLIVVLNDSGYTSETNFLRAHGKPTDLTLFPTVDYSSIARAFGIDAEVATNVKDLQRIVIQFTREPRRPFVVDARVTPEPHRSFGRYI